MGAHVTALVVEEGLAISNQVLQVADLRRINGGKIDFGDDPVRDGVPDTAGDRICRAYRVLRTRGPARGDTWTARRWIGPDHWVSLSPPRNWSWVTLMAHYNGPRSERALVSEVNELLSYFCGPAGFIAFDLPDDALLPASSSASASA